MKKAMITAVCLALVLTALTGCATKSNTQPTASGSAAVSSDADASTTAAGEPETAGNMPADLPKEVRVSALEGTDDITFGKTEGVHYVNESAGIEISGLDDKWSAIDQETVALIYDTAVDRDTGKAYGNNSDDGAITNLYDVMLRNDDTDEVISVSLYQRADGGKFDTAFPEQETEPIKGLNDSEERLWLEVAGKPSACRKISYQPSSVVKIPAMTEYDIYYLSGSKKQMVQIVLVTVDGKSDVNALLKHITVA